MNCRKCEPAAKSRSSWRWLLLVDVLIAVAAWLDASEGRGGRTVTPPEPTTKKGP